jgi:NIMA (never in mitosis gene a)-related kinase
MSIPNDTNDYHMIETNISSDIHSFSSSKVSHSSISDTHFYSHSSCSSKLNNYEEIDQIGSGALGDVVLYKRKSDNLLVCLKFINLLKAGVKNISELETEANLLKQLKHPNIVQYIDHFPHKKNLVIVMEYIEGITLKQLVKDHQQEKKVFPEQLILQIFFQIVSALSYCHSQKVIHRDIKPEHILLTNNYQIKLIDFGLSKQIEKSSQFNKTQVGTIIYMSPEMIKEENYSYHTDIWSLGCLIYELMKLDHPFSDNPLKYLALIQSNTQPQYNTLSFSSELITLIKQMIVYDPSYRISIEKLEISPFLLKLNPNIPNTIATSIQKLQLSLENSTKKINQLQIGFSIYQH